ncbi:exosome complex component RRP40 [Kwoniella heveanensis CBS 569]|uniref:Ribosomal RNA-processing protein 40 n=1 Tax=Kwoniella heveanensis BCC8398 TaxID=1296120 RepID=A0A1B9GI01_9TREE|nr:exosome complex component RRP40 [Kwoniella heveanensis BCC8398]OCF41503.1 exosome complex component RRP40 [Kwoniella heveanensis CBS 569]
MTSLVLPGDSIPLPSSSKSIVLGPGIAASTSRVQSGRSQDAPACIATRLGLLGSAKGKEKSEQYWVEGSSKRYIPAQKDMVLGTIIARHAEGYRVDLGSAQMASLEGLAFEGATKRSKPNLKVGTLVYARVSLANRDMEPEIECFDPNTGKAEGFGELKGGLMVTCSLQLCRKLLNPKFPVLPTLAASIPFEIAVGLNGRVWFKTETVSESIALKRIIEGVDSGHIKAEKEDVEQAVKEYLA